MSVVSILALATACESKPPPSPAGPAPAVESTVHEDSDGGTSFWGDREARGIDGKSWNEILAGLLRHPRDIEVGSAIADGPARTLSLKSTMPSDQEVEPNERGRRAASLDVASANVRIVGIQSGYWPESAVVVIELTRVAAGWKIAGVGVAVTSDVGFIDASGNRMFQWCDQAAGRIDLVRPARPRAPDGLADCRLAIDVRIGPASSWSFEGDVPLASLRPLRSFPPELALTRTFVMQRYIRDARVLHRDEDDD